MSWPLRVATARANLVVQNERLASRWRQGRPWRERVLGRGIRRLTHVLREDHLLRQPHTPWKPAVYGLLTLLGLLAFDAWIWPNGAHGDAIFVLQTLLAILGAATLAIFVSIGLFQNPGDYAALIASALADDPEREGLLRLVFYGITVTLGQLIAGLVWPGLVWHSIIFSGGVALLAVLFLFGYVHTRLRLFTPRELAGYLAQQAKNNQRQAMATPPRDETNAALKEAGRRVVERQERVLRRFCDLGYLAHHELTDPKRPIEAAAAALDGIFQLLKKQAQKRHYSAAPKVMVGVSLPERDAGDTLEKAIEWHSHIIGPCRDRPLIADILPRYLAQGTEALWLESAAKRVLLQLAADIAAFDPASHQVKRFATHWKKGFINWRKECLEQSGASADRGQPKYRWSNDLFSGVGITILAERARKASNGCPDVFGDTSIADLSDLIKYAPLTRDELEEGAGRAFDDLTEVARSNALAFYLSPRDRWRARRRPASVRADDLVATARARWVAQALAGRGGSLLGADEAAVMRKAAHNALDNWRRSDKKDAEPPPFWG